jgi:hypothetical protein
LNRCINNAVVIELLALLGDAAVTASAQTTNAPSVMHSEVSGQVFLEGEVSVTALAASEANRQALQQLPRNVPAIEQLLARGNSER